MAAFRRRGSAIRSAKVGPDFIDPGFHSVATGAAPRNLDPWICGAEAIGPLAGRAAAGGDLLVIEGVMGLFDGAVDGTLSSTADVARLLDAPVVLVVDASAMSGSVAALVRGYRDHDPTIRIGGVILNRVGSDHHRLLLTEALDAIDMPVLGAVPRDDRMVWRDRHLGLVPVEEQPEQVRASIRRLGALLDDTCDLSAIQTLADTAPPRTFSPARTARPIGTARVAVAAGPAFTFVYRDNLEAFEAAGAELVPFDPLSDRRLPADCDGVFIGGGFPEVFATELGHNGELLADLRSRGRAGLVMWAECGGLLLLARSLDQTPLAGVVGAEGTMTAKLTLGYREVTVRRPNPVAEPGTVLRGHEFHYSTLAPGGEALQLASRFATRVEGFATPTMLATYVHLHLGADPSPAERFVATCLTARPA